VNSENAAHAPFFWTPTVLSCLVLALECGGKQILTVEGLGENGNLHPLQDAFADLGAAQCGYCTPAILVTAKAFVGSESSPTRARFAKQSPESLPLHRLSSDFEAVEAAMLKIADQKSSIA